MYMCMYVCLEAEMVCQEKLNKIAKCKLPKCSEMLMLTLA